MKKLRIRRCLVCCQSWFHDDDLPNNTCNVCASDSNPVKKYSRENNMIPSAVPPELACLSVLEEMLVARACPIMRLYTKKSGHSGLSGHVINVPQNLKPLDTDLPRLVSDTPILYVRRTGKENDRKDFRVNRDRVRCALEWLKDHNPLYANVLISNENLLKLPENGVPPELLISTDQESIFPELDSDNEEVIHDAQDPNGNELGSNDFFKESFFPDSSLNVTEEEKTQNALLGSKGEPYPWPPPGKTGLNEFETQSLAAFCFPTLFPDGTGDQTNSARPVPVSLKEAMKHYMKYADILPDGTPFYRFAKHPTFSFWIFNMYLRHSLLNQARVYLRQHKWARTMSFEDLLEAAKQKDPAILSGLQCYSARVAGTDGFWFQQTRDLQTMMEQKGAPTVFVTLSCADNYWPDLHRHLPYPRGTNFSTLSRSQKKKMVRENPHLVSWYFHKRQKAFFDRIHKLFNTDWYYTRLEAQRRGVMHVHGCIKMKNDQHVMANAAAALLGFLAQKKLDLESHYKKFTNSPSWFQCKKDLFSRDTLRQSSTKVDSLLKSSSTFLQDQFDTHGSDYRWYIGVV